MSELQHFGVLGMKWGVRKAAAKGTQRSSTEKVSNIYDKELSYHEKRYRRLKDGKYIEVDGDNFEYVRVSKKEYGRIIDKLKKGKTMVEGMSMDQAIDTLEIAAGSKSWLNNIVIKPTRLRSAIDAYAISDYPRR